MQYHLQKSLHSLGSLYFFYSSCNVAVRRVRKTTTWATGTTTRSLRSASTCRRRAAASPTRRRRWRTAWAASHRPTSSTRPSRRRSTCCEPQWVSAAVLPRASLLAGSLAGLFFIGAVLPRESAVVLVFVLCPVFGTWSRNTVSLLNTTCAYL